MKNGTWSELNTNLELLKEIVADRLKFLRKGVSQEQVAAHTGGLVSGAYIRRVEKGRHTPSLTTIAILCHAYGWTLSQFFNDIDAELQNRRQKTA